jgi:hypothetical protein
MRKKGQEPTGEGKNSKGMKRYIHYSNSPENPEPEQWPIGILFSNVLPPIILKV